MRGHGGGSGSLTSQTSPQAAQFIWSEYWRAKQFMSDHRIMRDAVEVAQGGQHLDRAVHDFAAKHGVLVAVGRKVALALELMGIGRARDA